MGRFEREELTPKAFGTRTTLLDQPIDVALSSRILNTGQPGFEVRVGGIVGTVLLVAVAVVAAIVASRRKHRQHAIDIQRLIELRGRLDPDSSAEVVPSSPDIDHQLGGNAQPDELKN